MSDIAAPVTGFAPRARAGVDRVRASVDRASLRFEGRVDTPAFDRFTPWAWWLALGSILLWLAMARSHSIAMGVRLAEAIEATWLIENGYRPLSTLTGENLLAEHAGFLWYPVGVLTTFLPRVGTLLVVQSFALAAGVVPIWRLARGPGNLRIGATAAITFAFSVYTAVHEVNVAGFHIESLALPALLFAVLFGLTDRDVRMWIAIAVVLLARADLGLAVAGLGLLFALEGNRRRGGAVAAVGLGWIVVAVLVLQPLLAESGMWPHVAAFSGFGDSSGDILFGIITNPIDFLRLVVSRGNFVAVVILLAPVLFIPVIAMRYLLPALPLYAVYLAADVPIGRLSESPQTIPMTAFVFVATVFGAKRIGRVLVERVNVDRRLLVALLMTASVFFIRDAATSLYNEPWNWAERSPNDFAVVNAAALIPDGALVRASGRALPLLSERIGVYELQTFRLDPTVAAENAREGVDYILYVEEGAGIQPRFDSAAFCVFLAINGWDLQREFVPTDADGFPAEGQQVRLWKYLGERTEGCA